VSPAQVLERSYAQLKRRLLEGQFPSGQRLEATRLAEDMDVSITPVRDVLNRLAGEGLVLAIAGDGFYVPVQNESTLRDMLDWSAFLLQHSIRVALNSMGDVAVRSGETSPGAAALFSKMVAAMDSVEWDRALASLNDRISAMRSHDEAVVGGVVEELALLSTEISAGRGKAVARIIRIYHRRRRAKLRVYVARLANGHPLAPSRDK
jgi:DNA-binding transcriptional regulator YhcF (GntR family)